MTSFRKRKELRKKHFEENIKGWKLRDCGACSGSGRYDHNGSPSCGACDGTGKERYNPELEAELEIGKRRMKRYLEKTNSSFELAVKAAEKIKK